MGKRLTPGPSPENQQQFSGEGSGCAASFPRAFGGNPEFPLDNSLIVNMDARLKHSGMTLQGRFPRRADRIRSSPHDVPQRTGLHGHSLCQPRGLQSMRGSAAAHRRGMRADHWRRHITLTLTLSQWAREHTPLSFIGEGPGVRRWATPSFDLPTARSSTNARPRQCNASPRNVSGLLKVRRFDSADEMAIQSERLQNHNMILDNFLAERERKP